MSLITKSTYLRGPKGDSGLQGPRGERGLTGQQGVRGIQGPDADPQYIRGQISASGNITYNYDTGVIGFTNPGYATTAYVDAAISNLVGGAPTVLDTIKEIADAINNDPDFYNNKLSQSGGTMSGALILNADPINDLGAATKQYVDNATLGVTVNSSDDVPEGDTNLYYTTTRVRNAISVAGSGSYDSSTGVITVTGGVTSVNSKSGAVTLTTLDIGENNNLYFTDVRSRAAISVTGDLNYNSSTGVISYTAPTTIASLSNHSTTGLVEGTNLYFTTERVDDRLDDLIVAGKGLNKSYDDAGNLLTISVDFSEFNIDDITEGAVNQYFNAKTTSNLVEGTNLYFTDARAIDANKTAIDNAIAGASSDLSTEINRAIGAETTIANNLASEVIRATTAENAEAIARASAINSESAARIAGDTANATAINTEEQARISGDATNASSIVSETSRAIAAETSLLNDLATEVTRASLAENALSTSIANEATARAAGDATNATAITTEVTRATAAEGVIAADLAQELLDRAADDTTNANAIAAEVTRATAAEGVLTTAIATEKTRATAAEAAIAADLAQELLDRAAGDLTNANAIAAEVTRAEAAEMGITEDLATEVTARLGGDATNAAAIAAEAVTRAADDTTNANAIAAEAVTRAADDLTNANAIIAEATRATAAETTLTTNLTAEETARIAADTNLQNQINFIVENVDPVALDSLTEIVTAFQNADNDINGAITNLGTTLQNNINVEETARIAADTTLTNNLSYEVIRATTAENAESTARANAINTEEQARIAGDTANATDIADEVVRATNAESLLQSNLDNEAITRNQADVDIGQRITDLTTDNITEGSNLYYTDARARNSISIEGTLYYDSVNGVISTFSSNVPTEVRLGSSAGLSNQGFGAVAIGTGSGNDNQGAYSIAIGAFAGRTNQAPNSIVLSAVTPGAGWDNADEDWDELSWDDIDDAVTANTTGFFVKPVRHVDTTNPIYYNPVTGEISYGEFPDFALTSYVDAADTVLQTNIINETNARADADTNLQNQIDFIIGNTNPAALDSLTEIVAAFQNADNDINGAIIALGSELQSNIDNLITDDIDEGQTNLYYSEGRVNEVIANTSINSLVDVDTTTITPTNGQVLTWNGNAWQPGTSLSDDPTFNSVIVLGDITFGNQVVTKDYVDSQINSNTTGGSWDLIDFDGGVDYETTSNDYDNSEFVLSGSDLDSTDVNEEPRFLIKNTDFTAVTGKRYGINTTSNIVTVTLPLNPGLGEAVFFTDAGDSLQINPLLIRTQGNSLIKFCGEYYGDGINYSVFEHSADSIGFFWNGMSWIPYGTTTFQ